jgi:protein ImuA
LGGAVARQRLHAFHPVHPGQEGATAGFALALILRLQMAATAPVLWVQSRAAQAENGSPYGPGLAALGLDPARLVVVRANSAMDALAAAEMGLEETGLAGVIADLPARLPSDMLKIGKRLSLRAEQRRTPCCLLHATADPVEMPVASRWMVASRPLPRVRMAPDFTTAFEVRLTKNRFGALGRWSVAWAALPTATPTTPDTRTKANHASSFSPPYSFTPLPAVSERLAASPRHRPAAAPGGAQPVPLRPAAA